MIHSIWMLRSECAHFHGSMVDKCCTSQKINGLQSSFGRGTINPEIHICNIFRPYSVSHSPSQWRYRFWAPPNVQRRAICCASPRRQCQIMSDLLKRFECVHQVENLSQLHSTSISGCSQRFWGFMRQMIINTTLNWFPNGRSARSQVAHMQVCAFLRLTIGRVVGRLFVQEVEWYSEYTTLENPGKWIAMEAGDVVKW